MFDENDYNSKLLLHKILWMFFWIQMPHEVGNNWASKYAYQNKTFYFVWVYVIRTRSYKEYKLRSFSQDFIVSFFWKILFLTCRKAENDRDFVLPLHFQYITYKIRKLLTLCQRVEVSLSKFIDSRRSPNYFHLKL